MSFIRRNIDDNKKTARTEFAGVFLDFDTLEKNFKTKFNLK